MNRIWNRVSGYFRTESSRRSASPIECLGLSSRARNSLRRGGIRTVKDLMGCSSKELIRIRNFGVVSQVEVEERLYEHGFISSPPANIAKVMKKRAYMKQYNLRRVEFREHCRVVESQHKLDEEPSDKRRREGFIQHHREIPAMMRKKQHVEA